MANKQCDMSFETMLQTLTSADLGHIHTLFGIIIMCVTYRLVVQSSVWQLGWQVLEYAYVIVNLVAFSYSSTKILLYNCCINKLQLL